MAARTGLPAGVITCLFSDIEASTQMLRELGPRFDEVLAEHHALLRSAWERHDGDEVKTIGDSFFVVFADAGDAVHAAVDAERALAAAEWPGRVRIGMHTGYARPARGDYTALVVNQAARVAGAARGGQILLTAETAAGVDRCVVRPLGRFRVRDFDAPVELYAATASDVPLVEAPPRVPPADGHNLTRPATPIVGRDEELASLRDRVAAGRVTTLVGPGGVGKTRLAIEVALDLAAEWEDGVWFVDLASLDDPELIAEAIGAAVGAPTTPGAARRPEVLAYLRERQSLIVLDNCEQLAEGCARAAAEIIAACPRVGFLATSRGPLGLRGESVYRLAPLVAESAASLFLDRATGAAGSRGAVAELCAELDHLPLAIELAAARTTAIPPAEILRQIRRSHGVLRSRDPTLPDRQRSLGRLLDWSLDLLPAAARTVLGRLSVFAGWFDLDAAEVVGAGAAVAKEQVPALVWDLIDASLIRPVETAGATRYHLLTTVRAHAREDADAGELTDATRRLASLLLARVGPSRATGHAWVVEIELELDNVRGAAASVDDDAAAQALAWSIGRFHDVRDGFRDGLSEVRRFLDARPAQSPERVALLTLLADLHLRLGELESSGAVLAEAEALAAAVGHPDWDEAGVIRTRGELALRRDDAAGAAAGARRGLHSSKALQARARLHNLLGLASAALGDLAASAEAFGEELRAATAAGIETHAGTIHANLAETYLRLGDEGAAAHHQRISLGLARAWGQPVLVAFGLMVAARLASSRGRPDDAVALQTKADELLAAADYVLYDQDEEIRRALLAGASERMDPDAYAAAAASGAGLSVDAAADRAETVLSAVGSAHTPEAEAMR